MTSTSQKRYFWTNRDKKRIGQSPDRGLGQIFRANLKDSYRSHGVVYLVQDSGTKTGSDVNYIIFEILSRIRQGVYIHFHDIFYPFEYPKEWIYEGWGTWSEAYLLRAFLQYNQEFEIELFTSFMSYFFPEELANAMPLCSKGYKASVVSR